MSYQYKREPLIQEEATRLAQACTSHEERLVVWTLLDTGLRVGEFSSLSMANSYSRGDREFEKATAMLFPSKVAQRGRMRDHTAAPFRRRVTV